MTRNVCVVTGTRADYGLLRWVMEGIRSSDDLSLQVIATGMHLSPAFGLTYRAIEADGFHIDRKVEMLLGSDTPVSISKSVGLGVIGMADALESLQPDLLLVLGDRFEIFSAAVAATMQRIPIAHLHGGETTAGAIDEAIRHSLTKMSHLHFVAAEPYARRVRQLGESAASVFVVGGLGVDTLCRTPLMSRAELEASINFRFGAKNLIVTFHPATLDPDAAEGQMKQLLDVLAEQSDTHIIFTMPNADMESRAIANLIEKFTASHPRTTKAFVSLGQRRYLSCLQFVDGMVGNSSSGLTEMPTFRKGTINIGDRQSGRIAADSVISCRATSDDIRDSLQRLFSAEFQGRLTTVQNPYGQGGASDAIIRVLREIDYGSLLRKSFCDIAVQPLEGH